MRLLFLLAALTWTNASAGDLHCTGDADCARLGAGYQCLARKTACAVHPESSTCVERVCRRAPGWPVKDEDRGCAKDGDCKVVPLQCECMYCARPEDVEAGRAAAVSRKRAKAYEALGQCSRAQQSRCATAGPCAMTGSSEARCRAGRCVVEYVPRAGP